MKIYSCASYAITTLVEIWYRSFQSSAVEQLRDFLKFNAFQGVNKVLPVSYTCMWVCVFMCMYRVWQK